MPTLGANVAIRNGDSLDFCWKECVGSLLPVCDQVVLCDQDSDDGTTDAMKEWVAREPKLKYVNYPFTNPKGDPDWVVNWTNWAREQMDTEWNLQLDCDEVLHEDCYDLLRSKIADNREISLRVQRWNFWESCRTMIPFSKCLAHETIRVAKTKYWLPADFPHPKARAVMDMEVICLGIHLFHYGFLRHPKAFFKKEKFLQTAFTSGYDPQLDTTEQNKDWMSNIKADWKSLPLEQFHGTHPKIAHEWLRERGYEP